MDRQTIVVDGISFEVARSQVAAFQISNEETSDDATSNRIKGATAPELPPDSARRERSVAGFSELARIAP
jgi:hypothetical protein